MIAFDYFLSFKAELINQINIYDLNFLRNIFFLPETYITA